MNTTYLRDKPEMARALWLAMEEAQDLYPHYWLGWDGFVPMVCWV